MVKLLKVGRAAQGLVERLFELVERLMGLVVLLGAPSRVRGMILSSSPVRFIRLVVLLGAPSRVRGTMFACACFRGSGKLV